MYNALLLLNYLMVIILSYYYTPLVYMANFDLGWRATPS